MADPKIRYDILANAQGAESVDRLATELDKLDTAFDPAVAARAQALARELRELGAQQAVVERFRDLKKQTEGARTALGDAQAAAQKLGSELAAVEKPTRAQAGQMEKLRDAVKSAKTELQTKTAALDAARGNLTQFGVATDAVATKEVALRAAVQGARQEVQQLGQQQQAVQRFQELGAATETARARLAAADAALEAFRREMAGVAEPTRAQSQQLAKLAEAARQSQLAFQGQSQAQAQAGAALRAAGVDTERLVAAQARAKSETSATAAAAQQLAGSYRGLGSAATESANVQAGAHRRIRDGVGSISDQLGALKNISIAGILGGQTAQLLKSVGETADAYANLSARVRLVTGDGAGFKAAMEGIFDVAKRTSSGLESTATLFTRIAQAGKEIGVGQKEALALTESINQAVQLSGASATASDAAITQLIQGLQSGVLRGEEFNSVMEQAPRLAQALAAGLNVTTGELRNLAKEGKLTSATVIESLRNQSAVLQKEFAALPATLGRAVTNLSTEWTKFIGTLNSGTGATAAIAGGINVLAGNLDNIAAIAQRAGAVIVAALAVKGAAALRTFAIEAAAAAGSANLLSASIGKIPTVVNITIAAVGFEVGFQIGTMLYDNLELARKLGVGIVAYFETIVTSLQFVAEAAKAIFTDDTVDNVLTRYRQRAQDMESTFRDMWKEAANAPTRIGAAVDKAAQATTQLGQAGQVAGAQIGGAAGGAAAAVRGIGPAAEAAQGAIQALAAAARINLPAVGLSAADQAKALIDVALKSKQAAEVLRTEIPQAIAKLSGPELEAFRRGFAGALEDSIRASRRLADDLRDSGKSGFSALAGVEDKAQLLNNVLAATGQRAAEALGVDVVGASNKVTDGFQASIENLSILIRTLPQLKAAGVDTASVVAQALGKMIDGAKNQAEIDLILDRLKVLGTQGVVGPAAVAGAMQQAAEKTAAMQQKLEDATPGVQGLGEAARKAGVDFEQLTTGVSKGFRDGAQDVARLGDEIQKSGISAQRAGPLLAAAIDQRIAAAQTKEELELIARAVQDIGARSPLMGELVAAALEQIKRKAEAVSPALIQAQADAQRLGITLATAVAGGAEQGVEASLRAYERLKSGGIATTGEIKAAFLAVANQAIAAAGGIVPEWVKVEAATRGATIAVDEYGNASAQMAGAAGAALNQLAGQIAGVRDAIRVAAGEANKLAADGGKNLSVLGKNVDAAGFVTDASGMRISAEVQADIPEGGTFDKAAYDRAALVSARSGRPWYVDPQQFVRGPDPGIGGYGAGAPGFGTAGTSAPAPTAETSGARTVVISINGRTEKVRVDSDADAMALERLLRQLADGAARAGA